jgi:hypothetical protein
MTTASTIIHPVPYYSQWESPELVPDIIAGTTSAADDPLWPKSGAASSTEYGWWSWRLCGMACLRMCLDHWLGTSPPSMSLARECLEAGAYIHRGDRVQGLIYAPFTDYLCARWDLVAQSRPDLPVDNVTEHLRAGGLAMLSVHPSIRTLDPAPPRTGGHLVLAVGATPDD